jgi:hypothetical protein
MFTNDVRHDILFYMTFYVYMIINSINNKIYVGKAKNIISLLREKFKGELGYNSKLTEDKVKKIKKLLKDGLSTRY